MYKQQEYDSLITQINTSIVLLLTLYLA